MSTCCGKLFSKMGKGITMRFALFLLSASHPPFMAGDCQTPEAGVWWLHSQGGVQVPTGGEQPCAVSPRAQAVMAVFRMSPRAPYHATWCGSADTGEIPEPTVTVRMKENGSFFCRVGRKKGRSWRPPRSAHGSRALMHIFRPVRADQGDDDASVPRYPGFFW